jgi:hypothetical protein
MAWRSKCTAWRHRERMARWSPSNHGARIRGFLKIEATNSGAMLNTWHLNTSWHRGHSVCPWRIPLCPTADHNQPPTPLRSCASDRQLHPASGHHSMLTDVWTVSSYSSDSMLVCACECVPMICYNMLYPPVNKQFAIENGHRNRWFTQL